MVTCWIPAEGREPPVGLNIGHAARTLGAGGATALKPDSKQREPLMTHADVGVRQASATAPDLGAMPVWNLGDLYPSPTSAEFRRDLDRAAADAKRIADSYKGKLGTLGKDGAALAKAVKAYEALSDVMGRLGSYAGLLYAADTTDPAKAKFYGDVQEKLTAISTDLVFFELELNQIAETDLAAAMQVPALAVYKHAAEPVAAHTRAAPTGHEP